MAAWLTIEVQNGEVSAGSWQRAHGESLTEAAVTNGARGWKWHAPRWGVILELKFHGEQTRDAFRQVPAIIAALDAVPDPVFGLFVYPGRGGGSKSGKPRNPRPAPIAGAAAAEEPKSVYLDLVRD
jgi:hypothetical protein